MTDWHALHGDHFDQTRVLVTGGAGFIGSHLTEALLKLNAHVVVLDDLSGGDTGNFDEFREAAGDRLEFVKGSILDEKTLARCTAGCRYVFHQAALGSVPHSIERPVAYTQVNVMGTLNVLEAARGAEVERVMFAASAAAYGQSPEVPKVETMATDARSPYAASKVAGEALLAAYGASYALDTVSLRYFNIFGTRQNANSAYAAVIAAFAKALIQGNAPSIFGDGEQSRDFAFVHNVVHANLLAARCPDRLEGAVVNIACGKSVTVNELARLMAEMFGRPDLTATHSPDRPGDVKHSLADLGRAEDLLNYQPIVSFEHGLAPTCDWYQQVLAK